MTSIDAQSDPGQPETRAQALSMLQGFRITQMLYVAAKLGIPDLLKTGPKSSEELAQMTGADRISLHRLLRTLVGLEVFDEDDEGNIQNTSLSVYFRSDFPGTLYDFAMSFGHDMWATWGLLDEVVMTGKGATFLTDGLNPAEHRAQNPDVRKRYDERMATRDLAVLEGVIDAYDFSSISTLVDVGGGYGQYIFAILRKYPNMQGILFDLPPTIEDAKTRTSNEPDASRCALVAGSFFDFVPSGDACIIKSTLMSFPNDDVAKILVNCRDAVGSGGKVIVIERLLGGTPDMLEDLNMMIGGGGMVRTEDEYRSLLKEAGLNVTRVITTPSQYSIVESVPA